MKPTNRSRGLISVIDITEGTVVFPGTSTNRCGGGCSDRTTTMFVDTGSVPGSGEKDE